MSARLLLASWGDSYLLGSTAGYPTYLCGSLSDTSEMMWRMKGDRMSSDDNLPSSEHPSA